MIYLCTVYLPAGVVTDGSLMFLLHIANSPLFCTQTECEDTSSSVTLVRGDTSCVQQAAPAAGRPQDQRWLKCTKWASEENKYRFKPSSPPKKVSLSLFCLAAAAWTDGVGMCSQAIGSVHGLGSSPCRGPDQRHLSGPTLASPDWHLHHQPYLDRPPVGPQTGGGRQDKCWKSRRSQSSCHIYDMDRGESRNKKSPQVCQLGCHSLCLDPAELAMSDTPSLIQQSHAQSCQEQRDDVT